MARVLAAEEAARNLGAARAGAELLPPDARPGQCYARVFVPPKYETEKLTVLKSEASERVEIIPAKYEFTEEKVLIKEASQKVEVVPAQYDWAEEKVLMKPAATKLLEVPAEYEVVEEKVLVRPGLKQCGRRDGDRLNESITLLVRSCALLRSLRCMRPSRSGS